MNRLTNLRAPDTAEPAHRWHHEAACLGQHRLFLPRNEHGPEAVAKSAAAKRICDRCPVKEACLADAMASEGSTDPKLRAGIRGGLTPGDRYARHRRQRSNTPEPPTLLDRYLGRTEAIEDGHVRWTVNTPYITHRGRKYTGMQLAWALATHREPEGLLRAVCGFAGCVAVEHLTDAAMRRGERRTQRAAA
ncbi:WhiB family transcriptional regulator [Streptomyces sp. NPDC096136]|uniref:WhiB family transcriptional regulator n=1 Tax=Streptomyces sp. NPDC096136 TaxID=3366076 RepID=UPI003830256F